ncbi:MAG: hypothetical protein ACRETT_13075 [Steroidobacteraceae bacterium]
MSGAAVRDRKLRTVEAGLRWPLGSGFSLIAGLGHLELSGPGGGEYVFASTGLAYQLRRVTVDLGYYLTDGGARRLFPSTARDADWAAALIYRF